VTVDDGTASDTFFLPAASPTHAEAHQLALELLPVAEELFDLTRRHRRQF
jgi:hypothetical protein